MVRLGLVGAGAWGKNYLKTAAMTQGVSVSCVCRTSGAPVEGFSGVPVTSDVGELIGACDAVVVATPPDSHEAIVLRAIRAGKPVLLEKPAALSATAVDRMFIAASGSGVPLLVGHIHLFSPAFMVMREWTREWSPKSVQSVAGNSGPFRSYPSLYDWGPHDVSMCLSLFMRSPDDVEAVRYCGENGGTVDEITLGFGESRAVLKFGNGMSSKVRRFSVTSSFGESVYEDSPPSASMSFRGKRVPTQSVSPLQVMIEAFAARVRGGQDEWQFDPWIATETARILDLADHFHSLGSIPP